jgi:hypothetical protein
MIPLPGQELRRAPRQREKRVVSATEQFVEIAAVVLHDIERRIGSDFMCEAGPALPVPEKEFAVYAPVSAVQFLVGKKTLGRPAQLDDRLTFLEHEMQGLLTAARLLFLEIEHVQRAFL